jgi:Flp pilus assembly pilin Flp
MNRGLCGCPGMSRWIGRNVQRVGGAGTLVAPVRTPKIFRRSAKMTTLFRQLWSQEEAQDIADYAVMLAVILVIVVGTLRLVGSNANNVFSSVASSIGQ